MEAAVAAERVAVMDEHKALSEEGACSHEEMGRWAFNTADQAILQHIDDAQVAGLFQDQVAVTGMIHLLFKCFSAIEKIFSEALGLMYLFTSGLNVKADSGQEAYIKNPELDLVKMTTAYRQAARAVLCAHYILFTKHCEAEGRAVPPLSLATESGSFGDWVCSRCADEGARSRTYAWMEFVYYVEMAMALYTGTDPDPNPLHSCMPYI
jgi:hypothetical protein